MNIHKNSVLNNTFAQYSLSLAMSLIVLSYALTASAAEYVYISDNLRVGVRPEPVSSVPPISVVFTGMRLEVHERAEGYVKIRRIKIYRVG